MLRWKRVSRLRSGTIAPAALPHHRAVFEYAVVLRGPLDAVEVHDEVVRERLHFLQGEIVPVRKEPREIRMGRGAFARLWGRGAGNSRQCPPPSSLTPAHPHSSTVSKISDRITRFNMGPARRVPASREK